jgi:hypothetical protein
MHANPTGPKHSETKLRVWFAAAWALVICSAFYRVLWASDSLYEYLALFEQLVAVVIIGLGLALLSNQDSKPVKIAAVGCGLFFVASIIERIFLS